MTENLTEVPNGLDRKRDYHLNIFGVFIQNAWSIHEKYYN